MFTHVVWTQPNLVKHKHKLYMSIHRDPGIVIITAKPDHSPWFIISRCLHISWWNFNYQIQLTNEIDAVLNYNATLNLNSKCVKKGQKHVNSWHILDCIKYVENQNLVSQALFLIYLDVEIST